MTTPQNVSSRYVRNLLASGSNMNFELDRIDQALACTPSNIPIGFYYTVCIKRRVSFESQTADGATPEQAARNALSKFGVTFR